eukprot:m.2140 g.2140  ORF g.2140 m.2140 type:complete len:244 (+) comp8347_c0_seq1:1343-2074(+)
MFGCRSFTGNTGVKRLSTVIIAGWAASTPRVLNKYGSFYEENGIKAKVLPLGIPQLWFSSFGKSAAHKRLQGIPKNEDIILHVFSGSSTSTLPYLIDGIKEKNFNLVGIIFDSCPTEFSIKPGLTAVKILKSEGKINPIVANVVSLAGIVVCWLIGPSVNRRAEKCWLCDEVKGVPHLYIYCKDDPVASAEFVESWISRQKDRGISVASHCWEGAAHVRHFQENPELYKKQLIEFLLKHQLIE